MPATCSLGACLASPAPSTEPPPPSPVSPHHVRSLLAGPCSLGLPSPARPTYACTARCRVPCCFPGHYESCALKLLPDDTVDHALGFVCQATLDRVAAVCRNWRASTRRVRRLQKVGSSWAAEGAGAAAGAESRTEKGAGAGGGGLSGTASGGGGGAGKAARRTVARGYGSKRHQRRRRWAGAGGGGGGVS